MVVQGYMVREMLAFDLRPQCMLTLWMLRLPAVQKIDAKGVRRASEVY